MDSKELLQLIGKISPGGRDYVSKAYDKGNVEVLYSLATEENKGVFIKVENDDCCIFYASFANENNMDEILNIIKEKTTDDLSIEKTKEICFNVYGGNERIIKLVGELGFKLDMEGYHLEYRGEGLLIKDSELVERGYEEGMIKVFAEVFDSSYKQLCLDNGWRINGYSMNQERFNQDLINYNKDGRVRSFWSDKELVGAYIFDSNYITDLVIRPQHQNKGYGSYLIAHCIREMRNKGKENIRLRVTKSNVGAKRLYERKGFGVIGWFAEHSYK